jgi:hypothetical protein
MNGHSTTIGKAQATCVDDPMEWMTQWNGLSSNGRMDALLYSASQQPGEPARFSYPTPLQEEANMA